MNDPQADASTGHRSAPVTLPEPFLARLVAELDNETVRAIILRGSYARGDAVPPYSDIDLTLLLKESAGHTRPKRFVWREGYLVSISSHSYAAYRERLTRPEEAIFAVTGVQEARILLDKDGAFTSFQQEVRAFRWEPLQPEAHRVAGQLLMELSELVLRTLRVLQKPDDLLAKMLADLVPDLTRAVAVQRGLLLVGQHYYHRVQEAVGLDSAWTRFHTQAAGCGSSARPVTVRERGRAALRLFQETAHLLQPALLPEHWEAIAPLLSMVGQEYAHAQPSSSPWHHSSASA